MNQEASYFAANNPFASVPGRPGQSIAAVPSSFSSYDRSATAPGPYTDAFGGVSAAYGQQPPPPQTGASMYPSYQQYGAYQPSSFIGGSPTPPAPPPQGMGSWQMRSDEQQAQQSLPTHALEPEYLERVVEVPRIHVEHREKLVEVPQPQIVDRIVEVPQVQDVVCEVPGPVERRLVTREVPKIEVRQVERIVEVPQVEYQDRYIEVPVVHEIVRRIPRVEVHEIPIERIIQVPKKIVQEIEQPVYKPVPHLVQQAVEREIPVPRTQVQTMEVVKQVAVPVAFDDGTPEPAPQPQLVVQQAAAPPAPIVRTEVAPPVVVAVKQSQATMVRPPPVVTQGQSVVVQQSMRPGYMTPPTPPAVTGSVSMMPASVASVTVGPAIPVGSTAMGSMSALPMQSGMVAGTAVGTSADLSASPGMTSQSIQIIPGSMQIPPQSQTAVNPFASVAAPTFASVAPGTGGLNPFASIAAGTAPLGSYSFSSVMPPPQTGNLPPQTYVIPQTGNPYASGSFPPGSSSFGAGSMVMSGAPPASMVLSPSAGQSFETGGFVSQPGSFYRSVAVAPAGSQTPPTPPASGGDAFGALDRNHDGVVTREEFEQGMQSGVFKSAVVVK